MRILNLLLPKKLSIIFFFIEKKTHAFKLLLFISSFLTARSPYRCYRNTPSITTCWRNDVESFTLRSSHLEQYPFFKLFNKDYFNQCNLPDDQIPYRNNEHISVTGKKLKELIEHVLEEIRAKKTTYTHFILLQKKDFNLKKAYGLLVLKFKNYPFVLKLFIESPEGLARPFDKGIEPIFFFFMGGGINRHLTGFTRIPNRQEVLKKLSKSTYWSQLVDIPRKWFWTPYSSRWISVTGHNIGKQDQLQTVIPGIYCIIADEIIYERKFSIASAYDRNMALKLCNYLENSIDPHINNFMIEKGTNKLIIIDTEHFASLVGLREKKEFRSYLQWYFYLGTKCAKDMFLRTRNQCKKVQCTESPLCLKFHK